MDESKTQRQQQQQQQTQMSTFFMISYKVQNLQSQPLLLAITMNVLTDEQVPLAYWWYALAWPGSSPFSSSYKIMIYIFFVFVLKSNNSVYKEKQTMQ